MQLLDNLNWLKDFKERFDKDVSLLLKKEPLWEKCRNCPDGYCCGHDIYPVTMSYLNPFRLEEWWLMLEYVKDNFTEGQKKQLVRNILSKRPDCIFLFGNRCSVHPARAWACRVHPYTISFHPSPDYFPVGKLALPSCPSLAPAFGVKRDEMLVQSPGVLSREEGGRLVQVKLKKRKPVWLLDASNYVKEFESRAPSEERTAAEWEALLDLAGKAGSKGGIALQLYLEQMQGLKRQPDGSIRF
ncbi:MAG: YkgJ family cysteine cluster protein [Dehalococcoidaceae bacterium]|nr:YkgJ family cysteine cluster protein [Dehalococcoidaceae bacterium]